MRKLISKNPILRFKLDITKFLKGGKPFNMSKLIKHSDGSYSDINGNKITGKDNLLTGEAWKYLANKYGKDYANRVSWNTRNGNIYQNGKWRADYKPSGNKTVDWETATKGLNTQTFVDNKTGKTTRFNVSPLSKTSKESYTEIGDYDNLIEKPSASKLMPVVKAASTYGKIMTSPVAGIAFPGLPALRLLPLGIKSFVRGNKELYDNVVIPAINREKFMYNNVIVPATKASVDTTKSLFDNIIIPTAKWLMDVNNQMLNNAVIPAAKYAIFEGPINLSYKLGGNITKFWLGATIEYNNDNDVIYKLAKRGRIENQNWNIGLLNALKTINPNLLNELINQGWKENGSVLDFQKAMANLVKARGLGNVNLSNNSNFIDNRWGTETQSLYDILNNLNWSKENLGNDRTVPDFIDKPTYNVSSIPFNKKENLGYRTKFDYSNPQTLRSIGFKNYDELKDWVISNPTHGTSQDFIARFGKVENWDQNEVEKALGVKGTYRKGRFGDYSDMTRSMAEWAGRTNGIYDRNVANYKFTNTTISPEARWGSGNWRQGLNQTFEFKPSLKFKKGGLIPKSPIEQFKLLRGGHINFTTEVIHPL